MFIYPDLYLYNFEKSSLLDGQIPAEARLVIKLLVILVTCNFMLYLVEIQSYKSCSFSMK